MRNITTILSKLSSIKDDRYISLKDCLQYKGLSKYKIPICLGRDTKGEVQIKEFVDIGNLLISGMTSSGKSVFINSFINTVLLTKEPEEVKFIMIDSKRVELSPYNGIAHLLYPVCEDMEVASQLLDWCIEEIEKRKLDNKKKPYIVVVIDEFSDLMLGDYRTNSKLESIAKNGSKVGIYMLLSASVPRATVFTPELKEAIPTRLVGDLMTSIDSIEMIEEESGIELLGYGDMIYKNVKSGEKIRVQTPFISTEEQKIILRSISKRDGNSEIELKETEKEIDPLLEDAKRFVVEKGSASTSMLQRAFEIGYNRASRLIQQLEEEGIISKQDGANKRKTLITKI